jgi:hypothetical protein
MKSGSKMNKERVIIYILAILLVISVGYTVIGWIQGSAFQAGYNKGITDAVVTLYQQTSNCKATTINIGNITRQVIDTSCLTTKT